MCIAAFVWQAHPLYPFILLLNRDEYHNRPTKPAGWWWEGGDIVGGRDEVAGGTWFACSTHGRVAFLTNILELQTLPDAKSRGELPLRFLKSKKGAKEFGEELAKEGHEYNGFNLMMVELDHQTGTKNKSSSKMVYVTNRPKGGAVSIQEIPPGIHVLSNSKLDSPWPKAQRLKLNFRDVLNKYGTDQEDDISLKEMVAKLMRDTVKVEDASNLPHICSLDWEFGLSSIFVHVDTPLGCYGTRSTSGLSIRGNGEVSLYEIYLERDETWKEQTINYRIQKNVRLD
ncbi:hypothetical protein LguiA_006957 [Lonicera macranthoides]